MPRKRRVAGGRSNKSASKKKTKKGKRRTNCLRGVCFYLIHLCCSSSLIMQLIYKNPRDYAIDLQRSSRLSASASYLFCLLLFLFAKILTIICLHVLLAFCVWMCRVLCVDVQGFVCGCAGFLCVDVQAFCVWMYRLFVCG